jgi:hypothetical protein
MPGPPTGASKRVTSAAPAYLVHRIPGRARLRVPARRNDVAFFHELAAAIAGSEGVQGVEANPRAASLLITHGGALEPILEPALGRGLLILADPEVVEAPLAAQLRSRFQDIGAGLRSASNGQLDLATAAALFFLVAGLVQLTRGPVLAPATTLLFSAASLLSGAQRGHEPEEGEG